MLLHRIPVTKIPAVNIESASSSDEKRYCMMICDGLYWW
jgi:hypothetical protein